RRNRSGRASPTGRRAWAPGRWDEETRCRGPRRPDRRLSRRLRPHGRSRRAARETHRAEHARRRGREPAGARHHKPPEPAAAHRRRPRFDPLRRPRQQPGLTPSPQLHHFQRIDGALHAEGVPLETLAAEAGTPAYVYSTATLTRHYSLLRAALDAHPAALGEGLIAFAVKANSNLSVL